MNHSNERPGDATTCAHYAHCYGQARRLGLTKWFGMPSKNLLPASLQTRSRRLESPQKNTLSDTVAARLRRGNLLVAGFGAFVNVATQQIGTTHPPVSTGMS